MPRRIALAERRRTRLFELPTDEASLLKHCTQAENDIERAHGRRRSENQQGFAVWSGAFYCPDQVHILLTSECRWKSAMASRAWRAISLIARIGPVLSRVPPISCTRLAVFSSFGYVRRRTTWKVRLTSLVRREGPTSPGDTETDEGCDDFHPDGYARRGYVYRQGAASSDSAPPLRQRLGLGDRCNTGSRHFQPAILSGGRDGPRS